MKVRLVKVGNVQIIENILNLHFITDIISLGFVGETSKGKKL